MKKIDAIIRPTHSHWVGDGFPVRSLFSYEDGPQALSPFLLFDFAGPRNFEPTLQQRGVGLHPHRGFETVTIVYDGEVSHKDSTGGGGAIGPGDVQWMTAAGGILHEEFHSKAFSKTGGPFRMVQLWVNLPAKDKMSPPRYQSIESAQIPSVAFDGGRARIIAGEFRGAKGPASTFTPINLWDVRLEAGAEATLAPPAGHNAMIAVISGRAFINGEDIREAEIARFTRDAGEIAVSADGETTLLVLTGEPIDEPVVGRGPFVMNTEAEIKQAFDDYRSGRLARPAA
mgnify:FL=1